MYAVLKEILSIGDHGWRRVSVVHKIYSPPFVARPPIASEGGRAAVADAGQFVAVSLLFLQPPPSTLEGTAGSLKTC